MSRVLVLEVLIHDKETVTTILRFQTKFRDGKAL